MPTVADLLLRRQVRESVANCRSCALVDGCNGPVPFSGPSPNRIVVVGEAPGEEEDRRNVPFVGPAGKLLRGFLRHNGMEDPCFVNSVSCYPKRTPTAREVVACQDNLANQLVAISPRFILIVGGVALGAMGVEGRITDWRGNWFELPKFAAEADEAGTQSTLAMATWHPSAVLRNNQLEDEFRVDVENFGIVAVRGEEPWGNWYCVKCGKQTSLRVDVYGELAKLGMPLCTKCLATQRGLIGGGKKEKKGKKKLEQESLI